MKTPKLFAPFCLLVITLGCSPSFYYTNIQELPGENRFSAQGYFSNDPVPMLLNDTIWFGLNTPRPLEAYLLLKGPFADSALSNPNPGLGYFRSFVRVEGKAVQSGYSWKKLPRIPRINWQKSTQISVDSFEVQSNATSTAGPGRFVDHCVLNPALCAPRPSTPARYALLFSGGKCENEANLRYWNDLEFMYLTLRNKCGFAANNIVVVYKERIKANPSSPMPVNYRATQSGLDSAIAHLDSRMDLTAKDTLFVFVTNHGGGRYYPPGTTNFSNGGQDMGALGDTQSPMDEQTDNGIPTDENIYLYVPRCTSAIKYVRDDQWASKWKNLLDDQDPVQVSLYEQCFSGGFLSDMRAASLLSKPPINIAAAAENGLSFASPPYDYDNFSYLFTAALYGSNADGSALRANPDIAPADGKISIWEAYLYAKTYDSASDARHFIDDNGSGTHNTSDGASAKILRLRW